MRCQYLLSFFYIVMLKRILVKALEVPYVSRGAVLGIDMRVRRGGAFTAHTFSRYPTVTIMGTHGLYH